MITPEHNEFGILKAEYLKAKEDKKQELIEKMRENLLQRNGNEKIVELSHMHGPSIDLCSIEDAKNLFIADASLTHQGK